MGHNKGYYKTRLAKLPAGEVPGLKTVRQELGVSLADFAFEAGVSKATIAKVERGDRKASAETRERILQAAVVLSRRTPRRREEK